MHYIPERSELIPFNRPYLTGKELNNIAKAHLLGQLAGDGSFTKKCQIWLEEKGAKKALLTHSCTAALEMAALLCDLKEGDEVIMPSFTFVSTANAFVLRGATPVFVDIRHDTLNINELLIEGAITPRTRAIVVVHYAGVACEMDVIMAIAKKHKLIVIEDAAQACMSTYRGRTLGTIGDLGCLSFHETKNIISGEGGALLINRSDFIERAEIIREKGTDRSKFFRGEIDKYTWKDVGSSYLPGEITAAFLWAQMEAAEEITNNRIETWNHYHLNLSNYNREFRTPKIPPECQHNAHMYYTILEDHEKRDSFIKEMKSEGIQCVFHYVPLHSSIYGRKVGHTASVTLPVTDFIASSLIRLPLWVGMEAQQKARVIKAFHKVSENLFSVCH